MQITYRPLPKRRPPQPPANWLEDKVGPANIRSLSIPQSQVYRWLYDFLGSGKLSSSLPLLWFFLLWLTRELDKQQEVGGGTLSIPETNIWAIRSSWWSRWMDKVFVEMVYVVPDLVIYDFGLVIIEGKTIQTHLRSPQGHWVKRWVLIASSLKAFSRIKGFGVQQESLYLHVWENRLGEHYPRWFIQNQWNLIITGTLKYQ